MLNNGNPPIPKERQCPQSFRVEGDQLLSVECQKWECQCWVRDLDGTEHCGLIKK